MSSELSDLTAATPDRKVKGRELEEQKLRQEYLEFEVRRLKKLAGSISVLVFSTESAPYYGGPKLPKINVYKIIFKCISMKYDIH